MVELKEFMKKDEIMEAINKKSYPRISFEDIKKCFISGVTESLLFQIPSEEIEKIDNVTYLSPYGAFLFSIIYSSLVYNKKKLFKLIYETIKAPEVIEKEILKIQTDEETLKSLLSIQSKFIVRKILNALDDIKNSGKNIPQQNDDMTVIDHHKEVEKIKEITENKESKPNEIIESKEYKKSEKIILNYILDKIKEGSIEIKGIEDFNSSKDQVSVKYGNLVLHKRLIRKIVEELKIYPPSNDSNRSYLEAFETGFNNLFGKVTDRFNAIFIPLDEVFIITNRDVDDLLRSKELFYHLNDYQQKTLINIQNYSRRAFAKGSHFKKIKALKTKLTTYGFCYEQSKKELIKKFGEYEFINEDIKNPLYILSYQEDKWLDLINTCIKSLDEEEKDT